MNQTLNRQQRRKEERNAAKRPEIMYKASEVDRVIKAHEDALRKAIMIEIEQCVMRILAWTLHIEAGYGQKRIQRFIDRVREQYNCILADTINGHDIYKWCEDERIKI